MKALIIGATGATGRDLVDVLLRDPDYREVVIFTRRTTGIDHPKLTEVLTDFDNLATVTNRITGDILFSLLGTTLNAAGSKEKQWHVDYEIPLQFATIARQNGVGQMVLLSSYGASSSNRVFYSQLKGRLEEAISGLAFPNYVVFRPGLLLRKNTDRTGEKIGAAVIAFLNRLGIIRKYRPMPTSVLAEKMAKAPKVYSGGEHVVELEKIFEF